jgi:hypothetical protein
MMMATFHGSEEPCMEAIAVAPTLSVFTPNKPMKNVLIVVLFLTTTALEAVPEPHVVPLGISMFKHLVVTVVVTDPSEESVLLPPVVAPYWSATVVGVTDAELEAYTYPAAAKAAALAEFWSSPRTT